jgi:NTP pyrophosphatase (non-canonical NTP hydrolase)
MDFDEYQTAAKRTDTLPLKDDEKFYFLLLGLSDEVGQIDSLVKKFMRHDIAVHAKRNDIISRLGDALWYVAMIADHLDTRFSDVAEQNVKFLERRWKQDQDTLFSARREFHSDDNEKLPDHLEFVFERREEGGVVKMRLTLRGHGQVGDVVDDNEYKEDYYRFHDVIHIGLMACLRWSPVFRKLLAKKRKHDETTDRVEDGAKARDIEEALSRLIFQYFEQNDFLDGATSVDTNFLRGLRTLSGDREITWVTEKQWEEVMMQSAAVIRQMIKAKEGVLVADLKEGRIEFKPSA